MAQLAKASALPGAGIPQYYHAPEMRIWGAHVRAHYVRHDQYSYCQV